MMGDALKGLSRGLKRASSGELGAASYCGSVSIMRTADTTILVSMITFIVHFDRRLSPQQSRHR